MVLLNKMYKNKKFSKLHRNKINVLIITYYILEEIISILGDIFLNDDDKNIPVCE